MSFANKLFCNIGANFLNKFNAFKNEKGQHAQISIVEIGDNKTIFLLNFWKEISIAKAPHVLGIVDNSNQEKELQDLILVITDFYNFFDTEEEVLKHSFKSLDGEIAKKAEVIQQNRIKILNFEKENNCELCQFENWQAKEIEFLKFHSKDTLPNRNIYIFHSDFSEERDIKKGYYENIIWFNKKRD
ncbi:MAG: hypothetical protein FWE18_00010 [Alphaproteobacteria bacterium]|nr:hypothetical protein [Alphaproteobacteria bacterium]